MLKTEPEKFFALLDEDLYVMKRRAKKRDMKLACRPNIFSDYRWEDTEIMARHHDVQFYDYTKGLGRVLNPDRPRNYHLTFSRSETNIDECHIALENGVNVAVVFKDEKPRRWMGHRVIDGDEYDHRFLDPTVYRGTACALYKRDALDASDPVVVALSEKSSRPGLHCGFVVDYSAIREKESSTELIAV